MFRLAGIVQITETLSEPRVSGCVTDPGLLVRFNVHIAPLASPAPATCRQPGFLGI